MSLQDERAHLTALEMVAYQLACPNLARAALTYAVVRDLGLDSRRVADMAGADWAEVASCVGWDAGIAGFEPATP